MIRRSECVLATLIMLVSCSAPPAAEAPPRSPSPVGSPTAVPVHVVSGSRDGSGTTVSQYKGTRLLFTIRALSFVGDSVDASGGTASFDQPHVTFIDANHAHTVADAPKAELHGADKSVLMTGGVRAQTEDGNVLHCDWLRYTGVNERLHGEGHVRVTSASGVSFDGDTIDGNARLSDVRIMRR